MNLIAAVDKNWAIGRNNKLLVSIPDDMKFFRETTTGKVVVMGRKTLESFPGKKPLKNRVNIVLTGDRSYQADGAVIVHDMEELHEELKISDLVAKLDGACYVTRQSVQTAAAVKKAKKAIRQAFENSMAKKGASLVEIVSTCASGWKMSPEKANKWMEENMFAKYPLGDLKNE